MIKIRDQHNALIDKTVLTGFTVKQIQNPDALFEAGILVVQTGPRKRIRLDNCEFNSIQITTKSALFDRFVYTHGPHGVYAELDLSIQEHIPDSDLKTGCCKQEYHNLNCWQISDLKRRIGRIVGYFYDRYGITLDVSTIRIRSIEINRTVQMDYDFLLYERPIVFTMSLLSPMLRLREQDFFPTDHTPYAIEEKVRKPSTYIKDSGKKGIAIKCYDKGTQLRQVTNLDIFPHCMRLELTLKSPDKVRSYLKTNRVFSLTNQHINKCFDDFVSRHILGHYQERLNKTGTYLTKLFQACSGSGDRYWRRSFLKTLSDREERSHIPLLLGFDSDLISKSLKKAFAKRSSGFRTDSMDSLRKYAPDIYPALLQGDDTRLQELFVKLFHSAV